MGSNKVTELMLESGKIKEEKEKRNSNLTLVVLAAGMGSRYGGMGPIFPFSKSLNVFLQILIIKHKSCIVPWNHHKNTHYKTK